MPLTYHVLGNVIMLVTELSSLLINNINVSVAVIYLMQCSLYIDTLGRPSSNRVGGEIIIMKG